MYRSGDQYARVNEIARNILIDYNVREFPVDLIELAKKMGFNVIPYSAFEGMRDFGLLLKRSKDGFMDPYCVGKTPTIFYNDKYGEHLTPARKQSTIGHEIKHIVEGDRDDSEDDLCDHFARYLRCPIPLVIYKGYETVTELISVFGISAKQAEITLENIRKRKKFHGNAIFPEEQELIEMIIVNNKGNDE